MLERIKEKSIRWQIAASAIVPVLLVALLIVLTQPLTLYEPESLSYARSTALKIEMVTEQVRAAETPQQLEALFAIVSKSGLQVEEVSAAELDPEANLSISRKDVRQLVRNNLPDAIRSSFRADTSTGSLHDVLVVATGDGRALAFGLSPAPPGPWMTDKQINITLKVLLFIVPVLLLSLYAASMITAPLLKFAEAAETLKPDEGADRPFDENGACEIRMLAKSLNDMRSRVRSMIEDRTRMLRAISHDLRTPLTRLRLRAERSNQPELKAAFLADIAALSDMIDDTLIYLSKEMGAERLLNADLPSLLETVCADFADMGYNVEYVGPERFAYRCKPRWLARAVTNLVENSTKFAQRITVTLSVIEGSSVRISVRDDGPGLPADLRARVLEPFFKVDTARTSSTRTGFGLGLSIVDDIVRAHGGKTELRNALPHGLIVHIDLPAEDAPSVVSLPPLREECKLGDRLELFGGLWLGEADASKRFGFPGGGVSSSACSNQSNSSKRTDPDRLRIAAPISRGYWLCMQTEETSAPRGASPSYVRDAPTYHPVWRPRLERTFDVRASVQLSSDTVDEPVPCRAEMCVDGFS